MLLPCSCSDDRPLFFCFLQVHRISFISAAMLFTAKKWAKSIKHTNFNMSTCMKCFFFREDCDPININRWIGLHLEAGVPDCACGDNTTAACSRCRASWSWVDGMPAGFYPPVRFGGLEPHHGDRCAYIARSGKWAGTRCADRLKSVCRKGTAYVVVSLK